MKPKLRGLLWAGGGILLVHGVLLALAPGVAARSARNGVQGLGQVLAVLPAVLILIGLFEVWVPKEVVERGLGPKSGCKGVLLALLLGTGAAGPLYAAFPIGVSLRTKGARTANLVIFLGAWATIKLPMLIMESAFLGTRFALLRLILTVPGILACGFAMEAMDPKPVPATSTL